MVKKKRKIVEKNIITVGGYGFCWVCGRTFADPKLSIKYRQSFHHAIPKCLNPKLNIKIPVHQECHYKINEVYKKLERCLKSK